MSFSSKFASEASFHRFFFFVGDIDERLKESTNIIAKYPDRVPVSYFMHEFVLSVSWWFRLSCRAIVDFLRVRMISLILTLSFFFNFLDFARLSWNLGSILEFDGYDLGSEI